MRLVVSEDRKCDCSFLMSWAVVLVVLTGAASIFPATAFAQGEATGAIVGHVVDATGNGIPEADITITDQKTGVKLSTVTDDAGRFTFPQLKPGTYSIKAEAQGFRTQSDIVVSSPGQKQTFNFTLRDGYW